MSVMDKLRHMLKGHGDRASEGIDNGGDQADEQNRDTAGQVDKGPDALRQQWRSQQEQDRPPQ